MEMLTLPEICSSIPSTATLRENLVNYFDETKNLIEKISDDLINQNQNQKQLNKNGSSSPSSSSRDNDDDDSSDEEDPEQQRPSISSSSPSSSFSLPQEALTKLRNISECIEESTFLLAALAEIKFNRCDQLECDLEKRNDEIIYLQKKITELKSSTKFSTSWSSTAPELLSLRRSHDSRLDYVCKIKRELALEKSRNNLLYRKQNEIQTDAAAINLSYRIECDRLREELQNERIKSETKDLQISYLKKKLSEEKSKSRNHLQLRKRRNCISKINKNSSIKLLQRQLCALNVSEGGGSGGGRGNLIKKFNNSQTSKMFNSNNIAHIKPTIQHRSRLQTAPSLSNFMQFTNNQNQQHQQQQIQFQPTSAQLAVKYLDESTINFNLPRSLFPMVSSSGENICGGGGGNGDLPSMLKLPTELPVLTLDENF